MGSNGPIWQNYIGSSSAYEECMRRHVRPLRHEIDESGCWRVTSHQPNSGGYIVLKRHDTNLYYHRLAYEKAHGSIPGNRSIIHTCRNPWCVNPDHLAAGPEIRPPRDLEIAVDESTGCHVCTSHCHDRKGYVRIRHKGRLDYLHRIFYRKRHVDIPDGMTVKHSCGNRACVNVDHLYLAPKKNEPDS